MKKHLYKTARRILPGSRDFSCDIESKIKTMLTNLPIHLPGKPDEGIWYCISHYLGVASYAMLLVGLVLGLYNRWLVSQDSSLIIIGAVAFVVFSLNVVLCYYFSFLQLAASLSHVWFGGLLGLVAFTEWRTGSGDSSVGLPQDFTMNILLMISLLLQSNWIFFARITRRSEAAPVFLNAAEAQELLGMAVSGLVTDDHKGLILLLAAAFALSIGLFRVKTSLGFVNLLLLIPFTVFFIFPSLRVHVNYYALSCFCGRHLIEPFIDVYFNGLSNIERWKWFLHRRDIIRKLLILGITVAQFAFCVYLGLNVPRHNEWIIMTPLYGAFAFVWGSYHIIVFISMWCLMNKLTECLIAFKTIKDCSTVSSTTTSISLSRILAAKGVRHMCLIARRLAFVSLFMTCILTLVGWRVKTGLTMAWALNAFPLDCLVLALLLDLSASLGGTCAGFALVVPASPIRPTPNAAQDSLLFPSILPPQTIEIISERATRILSQVQRFFAIHLIDNCGSEYSSSSLSVDNLKLKLQGFFAKRTEDDLPFGSYLLFYSGPTHASGDWALTDSGVMTLQLLVDLWRDSTIENHQSRLILIMDAEHSHKWTKAIRRLYPDYVAIQTFYPCGLSARDQESQNNHEQGVFTQGFIQFNVSKENIDGDISSSDEVLDSTSWFADLVDQGIRPTYALSPHWTDFTFKQPSPTEFDSFSQSHFPRLLLPIIRASSAPFVTLSSLCCCVESVWKSVRRCKMRWFPPAVFDLGHDFKLVRS